MSLETEIAGLASTGAVSTRQKADLSGQPCQNCGTRVEGRYCSTCGQLAASFHRPFFALVGETITDTFALDGRLSRTLPLLLFRPGRLTRNYIDGQRARYVPPFRLFLLASLLFYLALFTIMSQQKWLSSDTLVPPENREVTIETEAGEETIRLMDEAGHVDRDAVREALSDRPLSESEARNMDRVAEIIERPELFQAQLEKWVPRFSVLLVPVTILVLAVLFIWRRRIYVYDHAIHALHLHSWMYLVGTVLLCLGPVLPGAAGWLVAVGFLVYTWRSLKVVGQSGSVLSVVRMLALLIAWVVSFAAIALTSIIVSGLSVSV